MFGSDLVADAIPGRGLFYSLLVHLFLLATVLYAPWSYWLPTRARLVTAQSMIHMHEVLFLPALEPMGKGGSSDSSSSSTNNKPKEDALVVRGQRQTGSRVQGAATYRLRSSTSRQFRSDHSAACPGGSAETAGSVAASRNCLHRISEAGTRAPAGSGYFSREQATSRLRLPCP